MLVPLMLRKPPPAQAEWTETPGADTFTSPVSSICRPLNDATLQARLGQLVAAELLCGAQGLEFLRPLRGGRGVERLYHRLRGLAPTVPPLDEDRPPGPDLERLARAIAEEELDPGAGEQGGRGAGGN